MEKSIQAILDSGPLDKQKLDKLVENALVESKGKSSQENRKARWELLLKTEIFTLAATEGKALNKQDTDYYDQLRDRLDLILVFTEHDACEQTFPFSVLQDLLETQTISSCSHIFSWIEERADRLTEGLVPQKGKALVLLRTLNDLLRRLSKVGSTTMFCGRILTFLSGVFPLGERSGVNLRGEYGPIWDGPVLNSKEESEDKVPEDEQKGVEVKVDDKMQVDEEGPRPPPEVKEEQKDDFFVTFWSLQLPFSRPPLFANPGTFPAFRDAVNKVLPLIKEATTKERAMMGSRSSGTGAANSLKRKREPETMEETGNTDYFFAKFLTSRELLDLEIADTHFRRQILFQLLILLHHVLTFTKAAKATWASSRNRSLQIDFTLEPADAQWVQETITKAMEELRQTAPSGRAFAETVNVILEREKNWVQWKNELCAPFDREPWSELVDGKKVGLEEATKDFREKMREEPKEWEHRLGSAALTEIWDLGYRDLSDLQNPIQVGEVKDFVKKVKQEDARIEMRMKTLERTAGRLSQARVKAEASKVSSSTPVAKDTNPPTAPSTATPQETKPSPAPAPVTRATPSTATSLHPSLPPKPGTAPVEPPAAPTPVPIVVPAPAPTTVSTPAPTATAAVPSTTKPKAPVIVDDQISKYEENKQRWSWLALRTARDQYLQHFGKIGTGDITLLAQEIEKEKKEQENNLLRNGVESISRGVVASATGAGDERGTSPAGAGLGGTNAGSADVDVHMGGTPDVEDVKMEER